MDEHAKIELLERAVAAYNSADMRATTADFSEQIEWDLTRSDIPGESAVYRGHDEYLRFINRWREQFGSTQIEILEAFELPDGRLYIVLRQLATGAGSGVEVEVLYVHIQSYENGKVTRVELFTDQRKGRAAAGLDPPAEPDEPTTGNLALARRGYDLWNEGGVEASVEHVWAPDIVFHEIPEAPDYGVFRGAESTSAHVREIVELGGHTQFDLRSIEGRGDYVLAILNQRFEGASGGVAVTETVFHVGRWRANRCCELRTFLDEDQARREYERLAGSGD